MQPLWQIHGTGCALGTLLLFIMAPARQRWLRKAVSVQAREGNQLLPALFCVPFIVKDNFDTVGMAGTAGAVALLDNYPAQDAQQVSRLCTA